MISVVIDRSLFVLGALFFISDLLFPVWLVGITAYLKKRGWRYWRAWLGASAFCVLQAYIVAKLVGYNIGVYALIWVGVVVSHVLHLVPGDVPTSDLTSLQSFLQFWLIPPITVICVPALFLYVGSLCLAGAAGKGKHP